MFSEYLENLNDEERRVLQSLIDLVVKLCPSAVEGISYGLPAFKYKNRPLIGFGVAKEHLSLYPYDPRLVEIVKPELDGYDIGKGVIRFTTEKPLPKQVVSLLVSMRMKTIDKN